jgi:hypothetical protein
MSFEKKQKRKKRLIKKRVNHQRAAKQALDAMLELQRNILACLIAKGEMVFSPERYWELLQELSGEEPAPIEYDDQMYWVVVSQLRKLDSWVKNLDAKGRQWQFNPAYVDRVCRQIQNGDLPIVSGWLEAEEDVEPVVVPTGKVLGDADHDVQRDSDTAAEGGTLHGDEP